MSVPEDGTQVPASNITPITDAQQAAATAEDDAKARIRIGSQRQGSGSTKVPPRVVTEFKTGADAPTPKKQVFVRLDQDGNFQPLTSGTSPIVAPQCVGFSNGRIAIEHAAGRRVSNFGRRYSSECARSAIRRTKLSSEASAVGAYAEGRSTGRREGGTEDRRPQHCAAS
ncbi:MAG: hypothetical protein QM811_14430 [Pirellulales bacterium]